MTGQVVRIRFRSAVWKRWIDAFEIERLWRRNLRIANGACRTWRQRSGLRRWLDLDAQYDAALDLLEKADLLRSREITHWALSRWSVKARFVRARRRAHVAMREAARIKRLWSLRRGVRTWRRRWSHYRVSQRAAWLKAVQQCRAAMLRRGLLTWRGRMVARRVRRAEVEIELRETLARGRRWADRLIGVA